MSIATYADLKSAVANWLNRSNLTARIPDFIALAETRMMYGARDGAMVCEPLRIRAMETSADVAVSGQSAALPAGYLQARRFYLNSQPIAELDYVVPDLFWRTYISVDTARPRRFTVEGENFLFGPTPDAAYTGKILYYKKLAALAADADTNWVLANAPGVYLHGALAEAHFFARNSEKAQEELSLFCGAVNALNLADKADRTSGSPWAAFTDTGNP